VRGGAPAHRYARHSWGRAQLPGRKIGGKRGFRCRDSGAGRSSVGPATSGADYAAKIGTLTFNPGETTKTIPIVVNGDSKEADETFYLDLFGNSGNSLFTKSRGIGTILNDD